MGRVEGRDRFSYPMYRDLRDHNQVLSGALADYPTSLTMFAGGTAERINGDLVSGNYFDVLGVQPAIGRVFAASDEGAAGASPFVVLSHGYWMRRFAGDPSILNQTIRINDHPMTVVGVAPPGFYGLNFAESCRRLRAGHDEGGHDADLRRPAGSAVRLAHRRRPAEARRVGGAGRGGAERGVPPAERAGNQGDADRGERAVPPQFRDQASFAAAGRQGRVRAAAAVLDADPGADGDGRSRAAHRLCERGEPAARPRRGAAEGSGGAARARRGRGRIVRQRLVESLLLAARRRPARAAASPGGAAVCC